MRHAVTVELDEFVVDALTSEAGQRSGQVPVMVVGAIRCYLNDRDLERPGWPYPVFLRDKPAGQGVELELDIDGDLLRSLENEAGAQGVTLRQMIEHATLYYVAEVDAGRITRRILDDLGER